MKKNKGISLIVLIITIVVIIILATAIIVNIAKTNIINNANEAVVKQDFKTMQEELDLYIADLFANTKGALDITTVDASTQDEVKKILKSSAKSKYIQYVTIEDGKIVILEGIDNKVKEWALEVLNSNVIANQPNDEDIVPEDVCKKWLETANIYSKYNYENLDEILSDENCLRELMLNRNSVDYMITQTTSIMPKICNLELGLKTISNSQYARYKVIENLQWCNSIQNSQYEHYFSSKLSMTPAVNSAVSYENKLYSTNKKGIYLYSDNGLAYVDNTTTYLPLAFDKDSSTAWLSRTTNIEDYPGRFGIKLDKDVLLYKTVITTKNGAKFTDGIYVQTSSDLENWDTVSNNYILGEGETKIYCSNKHLANTFVIYIPAINDKNNSCEIYSIEFFYEEIPEYIEVTDKIKNWFEKASIIVNLNEQVNINQYRSTLMNSNSAINYMIENTDILKIVLNNSVFRNDIFESKYITYKIATNPKVYNILEDVGVKEEFDNNNLYIPKITSVKKTNSTGIYSTNVDYISIYSYSDAGDPAYNNEPLSYLHKIFDRNLTNYWESRTTATQYFPARVGVMLDKEMVCYKIEMKIANVSKLPNGISIQASNDLSSWNDITENITQDGTFNRYITTAAQGYKNYVVYIPSITSSNKSFQIYELKLYLVEKFE